MRLVISVSGDLSGMQPIPDDQEAHVDEDGILQVPMELKFDPSWLK